MPLWDKEGKLPTWLDRTQKRNCVATPKGWVRRIKYTDAQNNERRKDEILVAIESLSTSTGAPNISDIWHSSDQVESNTAVTTYVAFDEPVVANAALQITISDGGENSYTAVANTTTVNADNTFVFVWTPTVAATYSVEAQTIANNAAYSGHLVASMNDGNEAANLVITTNTAALAGDVVVVDPEV